MEKRKLAVALGLSGLVALSVTQLFRNAQDTGDEPVILNSEDVHSFQSCVNSKLPEGHRGVRLSRSGINYAFGSVSDGKESFIVSIALPDFNSDERSFKREDEVLEGPLRDVVNGCADNLKVSVARLL